MTSSTICILIAIVVYLAIVVAVGVVFSRKNKNVDDFYLGGRKLGPFVTAMSAEASDMSGWLLMGLPGLVYLCGIAEASWTAIGLALGTYVNWLILAKRLRNYSSRINAITVPDFFAKTDHTALRNHCGSSTDYFVLYSLYCFRLFNLRKAFWHTFWN